MDADTSSETGDPLVGQVIHDRFRVIAPIARGGMGAVYKAEQAPLGRLVAIKVLSPKHDEDKDPEFRKRFFLEAATVAKLSHPNTVTVFDYGQSDGLFFIVMELIDGLTLKQMMKRDGPFSPARAIHVAKQICRSLREAHRLGVIHRDMKPGNVMLLQQGDEQDYVKVLDFGLVKDIGDKQEDDDTDLTQAGVFMGSPKYMSPEQIQGDRVDGRSDIYSLGVLLYEMLLGRPPFVRDKQVQILMDHINAPVPPMEPDEGASPVPVELQQIVLKCLSKRREDRFEDMEQLLIALKTVAGELAMQLPPSGEMGTTGNYPLGATPVSGIHALRPDALATSSSGSISAPAITGGGVGPAASVAPAAAEASQPVPTGGGRTRTMIFAGLGVALAIAVGLAVVDPFGADEAVTPPPIPEPPTTPVDPSRDVSGDVPEQPAATQAGETEGDEPAPIRSVMVEVDSTPAGATVTIDDREYGATPAQVELTGEQAEPGHELTFVLRRDGYRDATVTRAVPSEGPLEVEARLRRAWRRPPSRPGGGGASATDDGPAETVTPPGYRESPY